MSKKNKAIPQAVYTPILLSAELEKNFRALIRSLKIEEGASTSHLQSDVFFGGKEEGFLFLSGQESDEYNKILKSLILSLCQSETLSSKRVGELYNTTILEALDINSLRPGLSFEQRLDAAITNFKNSLRDGYQEYCIYYPVFGMIADGLPFSIGNVEFGLFQDQYTNELNLSPQLQSTEEMKIFSQRILDDLNERGLWGKPFAKVRSSAYDQIAARRNALREIRACLEVLNFFCDLIPYTRGFVFLPGEAGREKIISPLIDVNVNSRRSISYEIAGPLETFSIKALLKLETEHGVGYSKVQHMMSGTRNEYEEILLTAIRWAGKATVLVFQDRKEDAFLHYMIALVGQLA